ncbi:MAG: hypothetical protein ABI758_02395 [Candidatus Woesebacteria bacterium]
MKSDEIQKLKQTEKISKEDTLDQVIRETADKIRPEKIDWNTTTDTNEIAVALYMPEYKKVLNASNGDYLRVVDHFKERYGKTAKLILTAIALAQLEERG